MEVHHHSHHPKKFKEYITEFLMLFFAVTLGFFAENLREHQIEKDREIQFLENIHYDLEQDIKDINTTIAFNIEKQKMNDSLILSYKDKGYEKDLPRYYYLLKNAVIRKFFEHSATGFTQLKNAGGLRLIKDKSIIQKIIVIEGQIKAVEKIQESMDQNLLMLRESLTKILNPITNNEMSIHQNLKVPNVPEKILRRFNYPQIVSPLLTNDEKTMAELVNLCMGPVNTTYHINLFLTELKSQEEALNKELIEKYGTKFHN